MKFLLELDNYQANSSQINFKSPSIIIINSSMNTRTEFHKLQDIGKNYRLKKHILNVTQKTPGKLTFPNHINRQRKFLIISKHQFNVG